jgi:hypothetical protein
MNKQKDDYRTFKVNGQLVKVDDFYYRRLFRDADVRPRRKYTFIRGISLLSNRLYLILKAESNNTIPLSRYIMRASKGEIVDHINRNPLDNRKRNLRIVTGRQNMLNRRIRNNTGLIGVSVSNDKGKFYASTSYRTKEGKRLTFYCKDTPNNRILAAIVHDKFVIQSGDDEYAPLNFAHLRNEPFRSRVLKTDISEFRNNKPAFFAKRFGIKISI